MGRRQSISWFDQAFGGKASMIVGQVFRLSLKLKKLKQNIKEWIKNNFGAVESLKSEHLTRVAETGLQG